jgi:hypothetical protein
MIWLTSLSFCDKQSFVKGGYFLSEDISKFDASFFSLPGEIAGVSTGPISMFSCLGLVYKEPWKNSS